MACEQGSQEVELNCCTTSIQPDATKLIVRSIQIEGHKHRQFSQTWREKM